MVWYTGAECNGGLNGDDTKKKKKLWPKASGKQCKTKYSHGNFNKWLFKQICKSYQVNILTTLNNSHVIGCSGGGVTVHCKVNSVCLCMGAKHWNPTSMGQGKIKMLHHFHAVTIATGVFAESRGIISLFFFFCTAHLPNERVSSSGVCLLPLPSNWLLGCHSCHVNATRRVCGYSGSWNVVSHVLDTSLCPEHLLNRCMFYKEINHHCLTVLCLCFQKWRLLVASVYQIKIIATHWKTTACKDIAVVVFFPLTGNKRRIPAVLEQLENSEYYKLSYRYEFPSLV